MIICKLIDIPKTICYTVQCVNCVAFIECNRMDVTGNHFGNVIMVIFRSKVLSIYMY